MYLQTLFDVADLLVKNNTSPVKKKYYCANVEF